MTLLSGQIYIFLYSYLFSKSLNIPSIFYIPEVIRKKMEKIKVVAIAAIAVVAVAAIVAAVALMPKPEPTGLTGTLTIAGSTTPLPIVYECARLLMERNPGLRISVSAGGTGHGIKAAGVGDIDIGMASRDLRPEEKVKYPDLKEFVMGRDSVAIIAHPDNPLKGLTMENASKIFAGEIKNWKEVGGVDSKIHVITREVGSGTRGVFEDFVMDPYGRTIHGGALVKPSNGEVRAAVSKGRMSIGYLSLGYVDETVKGLNIDGIAPTVDNVIAGKYPILRNLNLLTKGEPGELEKAFIDFVMTEEGQKIVEELGYIRAK